MNYYRPYPDGSLRCRPGNAVLPSKCSWHHEHYWCYTCEGYYGVPHDGIHEGPSAHPLTDPRKCVCRPCVEATARLDDQRRDPDMPGTKETTYLAFRKEGESASGKTEIFSVNSRSSGDQLGTIKWYGAWRQYCFYPANYTIFNRGCMEDIIAFIAELHTARVRQVRQQL